MKIVGDNDPMQDPRMQMLETQNAFDNNLKVLHTLILAIEKFPEDEKKEIITLFKDKIKKFTDDI